MELIAAAEADARWLGMPTNLKMFRKHVPRGGSRHERCS